MNGDASSLIDNVELGTLMGLDGSSDKMLLSLAYGSEGVDYEIDRSCVSRAARRPPPSRI